MHPFRRHLFPEIAQRFLTPYRKDTGGLGGGGAGGSPTLRPSALKIAAAKPPKKRLKHLSCARRRGWGPVGSGSPALAKRFNCSADGKSKVGGIFDNKSFRQILDKSLVRSSSQLPRDDRLAAASPSPPVGGRPDSEIGIEIWLPAAAKMSASSD